MWAAAIAPLPYFVIIACAFLLLLLLLVKITPGGEALAELALTRSFLCSLSAPFVK